MRVDFKIDKGADLARALENLGPNIGNRGGNAAVRAAARPVIERAQQLAPVLTGELRKQIGFVKVRKKRNGLFQGRIGVVGNERPLEHLIEFGTAPHTITAKGKTLVRKSPLAFFGKTVQHPGTRAQPFLGPAVHQMAKAALDLMAESLRKTIARAGRK